MQKFKYSLNNFEELINTLIKKDELVHYKTRSEYIQINTKENLMYAENKINKNFKNKAAFFDRDGVLNKKI